jgi:hypothetical protein
MRVLVVDQEGELLGIAGLVYHPGQMLAFSSMKDEMRRYPVTIMRTAKRFTEMIERHGESVVAVASKEEANADAFLERVGFQYIGDSRDGRIYKWQTQ